ncbi:hypothetical protein SETIT_8G089800v2 [Setaria italica]|uniref:Protein kinase domain-containing protein n=2 Tax=Setaria italica TaxID=4555 RepID=A0A368S5Y4_SETIT|nr:uncharacterized protein LOC101774273 isoform X2 [Setaria italica]RCV37781.1 hypothetical protein SETIT_8G089800v2 [Setaria italica]
MDPETSARNLLEQMLLDGSAEPIELPLPLLIDITNNFSNEQIIGRGGNGVVYMGLLQNGAIAVKKFSRAHHEEDSMFDNEVNHLMRLKHKNIVRFLGYCSGTQRKVFDLEGNYVMAEVRERLLCFEYVPNGSLDEVISDLSRQFLWTMRYQIIRGICEGLHHLHDKRISHIDLRPLNILLDDNMVPKICDFDSLRSFDEGQTREITIPIYGAHRYSAPETFTTDGVVTFKSDIYCLGIMISEILTREKQCSSVVKVLEGWRERLKSGEDVPLEQIRVCAEICIRCCHYNPKKRPAIQRIIEALDETESMTPDTQRIIEMLNDTESMDEFIEFESGMNILSPAEEPSNGVQQSTPTISGVESSEIMELNILERIVAGREEPSHLDLPLLYSVTESFSKNRRIGQGGCGEVYKGILRNADVAVKKLFNSRTIKGKMFHREVKSLITVRHHNIVRFLGYCSFTEERAIPVEGQTVMVEIRERLLCFEYISNGSLERHITDELRGLEWRTRFDIIVGICNGLCYLHKEKNITHMDLKPANILVDDQMVPKITDFGLSRLDNNPQATTTSRLISPGYSAPEYRSEGKSSLKSDIYSLGVIILELVSGSKNNPNITKVLRKWRHRWIKSMKHTPLGYQQVTKCIDLAQRCMEHDPADRPDISDIVQELNEIDSNDHQFQVIPSLEDMLGIEPLEIQFPFEHYWQVSHTVELSNDTDDHFAFVTKPSLHGLRTEPDKGIVPPRSKCSVTVTMMQAQVMVLLNNRYKEEITVLSTRVDGGLSAVDITKGMFMEEEGKVVDEVNVMVDLGRPPLEEES